MTGPAVQALLSHWRAHPLQLVTLLTGIALATCLWSTVQAINAEARASYARANTQLAIGQFDELQNPGGYITVQQYVELRRAGWQVAAVLEGTLRVGNRHLRLMGVDMVAYPALPSITEVEQSASASDPSEILTAPGRLLMSPGLVALFEATNSFPPIIETSALPPDLVLTDIGVAERLLDRAGQISRLLILPQQPRAVPTLASVAPALKRISPSAQMDTAQLTDSFHLNLTAFGLLSFAVGLFIVHGTVGLAFAQRRGMFRTLRALGLPLRRLVAIILGELLLIALIGSILGLILGFFLAGALLPDVAATLRGLYGAPVDGQLSLRPQWIVAGLAMAIGGTLVANTQALWRLSRMSILAGPGLQSWRGQASTRITGALGLGLITAGIVLFLSIEGLLAGFGLLAGVLTGTALTLPMLLSAILNLFVQRAHDPLAQWVWADMRAQLPGLSLALMALLLALAANIGVGTMVSSFRLTFTGWLEQRLSSELYVTANDDAQALQITDWLTPQVSAILPIRSTELPHETGSLFLYGIIDDETYRRNWPLIAKGPDVWDHVLLRGGVLINEQLARRTNLWPGDTLMIAPDHILTIAGVYSDYGNPTGQAIVAMPVLDEIMPGVSTRRFGIRIAPERASDLTRSLRDQFDLPARAVVHQAAMKAQSLAIFEKTFVVTSALNVLTLGIAGFAMLTSLLTLWTQRLPQVAPIWALGLTRVQLAGLEILRSVILAALTAFLALPLGLVLAWVLLSVINVQAFGWRLPMHLFPIDWISLFLMTLIAATLAAALPAWRLLYLPPAALLRVFANER